jgi:tryptophan-rich sensory protein
MKNFLVFMLCLVLCYAAGAIGSIFTFQSIPTWYAGLVKPPLNPPNWIFGPVWSALYTLMAIAVFLVVKKGFATEGVKLAVYVFAAQLVFNTLWSVVFFGARTTFMPIFIIVALWISILACIILFWKISKTASIMMMPYLLWVSFASYLNIGVFILNK